MTTPPSTATIGLDVRIQALTELTLNLRWTWDHGTNPLWAEMESELWCLTHNAWVVLQTVSRGRLREVLSRPEYLDIHLPSADRFVELTVLGAATSIPAFARLNTAARAALVEAVGRPSAAVSERYREGDIVSFPMFARFAVASATGATRSTASR